MVVGQKQQTDHIRRPIVISKNGDTVKCSNKVLYLWSTEGENLTWIERYKRLKSRFIAALSSFKKVKNVTCCQF